MKFEENHKEPISKLKIYMSILIILSLPLYSLVGYLWNQEVLFQQYGLSLLAFWLTLFYAVSCLITSIAGTLTFDEDVESSSNILGMISAAALIPACIMVYGCVKVG